MKNFLKKKIRKIVDMSFIFLAKITKTNLTLVGYYQKGILKHGTDETSGEKFVIENVLKNRLLSEKPIFFDVGSNTGYYSVSLKKQFPHSTIYSFEANINTFNKISKEALSSDIKFHNLGLASTPGIGSIYDYKENVGTEHASIYKEVLTVIHHSKEVEEIKFSRETLDNFCSKFKIDEIDFLKIDTEGSEFDVLKGSEIMLRENKIKIIQFEFNETNVFSKVFLKDYYDILSNYNIYRIDSKKIIPLPEYKTENEIFKYQNFLAISKSIDISS
ncbi:MAG: FkbM family methyltransferase [bacterium]